MKEIKVNDIVEIKNCEEFVPDGTLGIVQKIINIEYGNSLVYDVLILPKDGIAMGRILTLQRNKINKVNIKNFEYEYEEDDTIDMTLIPQKDIYVNGEFYIKKGTHCKFEECIDENGINWFICTDLKNPYMFSAIEIVENFIDDFGVAPSINKNTFINMLCIKLASSGYDYILNRTKSSVVISIYNDIAKVESFVARITIDKIIVLIVNDNIFGGQNRYRHGYINYHLAYKDIIKCIFENEGGEE